MLKRVTSLPASFHAIAPAGNKVTFEEMLRRRRRAVGSSAYDLMDPRIEPQTFCSKDESITDRPTCWSLSFLKRSNHLHTLSISIVNV